MRTATVILSLGCWSLCSLGCFFEGNGVVTPDHVPFERVFALEDTIRLDPNVMIGSVRALDVDDKGQLLLVDSKNRSVQLFSKTGEHRHSMRVAECDPGTSFDPETARFIENGQVVVRSGFAAGYVFSSSGECVAVERSEHVRTAMSDSVPTETQYLRSHP